MQGSNSCTDRTDTYLFIFYLFIYLFICTLCPIQKVSCSEPSVEEGAEMTSLCICYIVFYSFILVLTKIEQDGADTTASHEYCITERITMRERTSINCN